MKKNLCAAGTIAFLMALGFGTAYAQQIHIDQAVRNSTMMLSPSIGRGSSIAVIAVEASSISMSNYLINEMIAGFVDHSGRYGFSVVNRAQLDIIVEELELNISGLIDDATAQSVGRLMGVQFIVTGTFESVGGFFRLRTQLIEVETAIIRGLHTVDVENDPIVAYLIGAAEAAAVPIFVPVLPHGQPHFIVPFPATHNHFTSGQRWVTWFLNVVPGLGSFVVMGDTGGGIAQLICGVGGWALIAFGQEVVSRGGSSYFLACGIILLGVTGIINTVRSVNFRRNAPAPRVASMPESWNIGLVSGENRIDGVSLTHIRRF